MEPERGGCIGAQGGVCGGERSGRLQFVSPVHCRFIRAVDRRELPGPGGVVWRPHVRRQPLTGRHAELRRTAIPHARRHSPGSPVRPLVQQQLLGGHARSFTARRIDGRRDETDEGRDDRSEISVRFSRGVAEGAWLNRVRIPISRHGNHARVRSTHPRATAMDPALSSDCRRNRAQLRSAVSIR